MQKKVLIYSGTTEGRILAKVLAEAKVFSVVCVATDYGEDVMEPCVYTRIQVGRQSPEDMRRLLGEEPFAAVVDATHPYAVAVTAQIKESLDGSGIPYFRLQRRTQGAPQDMEQEGQNIRYFSSAQECAGALADIEGNILLTTGSKELGIYAADAEVAARMFVRVLPGTESLALCERAGLKGRQIIAMQGPFSKEMNLALLHQYQISCMVTKESGRVGGLEEKLEAAKEAGVLTCLIGNPEKEKGNSLWEVLQALSELLDTRLDLPERKISLVGMGMGNMNTLTKEAEQTLQRARYLFGAGRLLEPFSGHKHTMPFYQAKDILPCLKALEEQDDGVGGVAILFSGDTGYYSGAGTLYRELRRQGYQDVTILPGISTVSCLSARTGIPWQDARLVSLHGKKDGAWEAVAADAVRHEGKSMFLLSGKEQVRQLCELLEKQELGAVWLYVAYQLSYSDERVARCTPRQWLKEAEAWQEEGLYAVLALNARAESKKLNCGCADAEFIRDKVPMTKEEIRSVAIAKLRLTEPAVVYDIGSGTGSIATEIAALSPHVQVFALECKEEACELIVANARKFHRENLTVVYGMAPESMGELPSPTHAFIGGSKGKLGGILQQLYEKNPTMRVVITAISLETIAELTEHSWGLPLTEWEMVQVQVGRAQKLGNYQLLQGQNPVMICSFRFGESCGESEATAEEKGDMSQ
ncbi:MAG: precorrin-6A reductase [Lachnospiraceae bacterium]|nr:precorrin-6A reductase [Lachnospiraceae bacterium]